MSPRLHLDSVRLETVRVGRTLRVRAVAARHFQLSAFCGLRLHVRSIPVLAFLAGWLTLTGSRELSAQPLEEGRLTRSEVRFIERTLRVWGFADTARSYLQARLQRCSNDARPDLEFYLVDCLAVEGKSDEYTAEIQRLQKKYPTHPRSKAAGLQVIQASFLKVLLKHDEALAAEPSDRRRFQEERDAIYEEEVVTPLARTIEALNGEVDQVQKQYHEASREARKNKGDTTLQRTADELEQTLQGKKQLRDEAEHYRVVAARMLADRLPEGSEAQREAWQAVATHAEAFVRERFDDFARQCECQLMLAIANAQLGRVEEAADAFELLVEISPPARPPYTDPVVLFFRRMRLEAAAGTARAYNRAGQPEKAVELFDRLLTSQDPHFPFQGAENHPELASFKLAMDIEEAIARTVGQDGAAGVQLFLDLVERTRERSQADSSLVGLRLDLARGLSRLLDLGAGGLPPSLYRLAGTGYLARGQSREAIVAWKRGLAFASRSREPQDQVLAASLLNDIGLSYQLLGEIEEAAMAFTLVCEAYGQINLPRELAAAMKQHLALASQNGFALLSELTERYTAAPWQELLALSQQVFGRVADGSAAETMKLQQAGEFEDRAQYAQARERYASVGREVDGQPVFSYYQGKTGAARAAFLAHKVAGDPLAGIAEAEPMLSALETEARQAPVTFRDAAQVLVALTRASLYWDDAVRNAERALAALQPLAGEVRGGGDARELALNLWINILVTEQRPGDALPLFDDLRRDFPESDFLLQLATNLIQANLIQGDEAHLAKAGELASFFVDHPKAGLDELSPENLLYYANALVEGNRTSKALPLLDRARTRIGDDADASLDIAISLLFAKVALDSDPAGAQAALMKLIERHPEDIQQGLAPDAPNVLRVLAEARLKVHAARPAAALLESANQDLMNACGVLDQRRRSAVSPAEKTRAQREYYEAWLELLLVWKAQGQDEKVVRQVNNLLHSPAVPADLAARYEQLRKDSSR